MQKAFKWMHLLVLTPQRPWEPVPVCVSRWSFAYSGTFPELAVLLSKVYSYTAATPPWGELSPGQGVLPIPTPGTEAPLSPQMPTQVRCGSFPLVGA